MSTENDPRLPDILAELKNQGDGYRAPDAAYFDRLADEAIVRAKAPAAVRRLPRRTVFAAAATFLLLVVAVLFFLPAGTAGEDQLAAAGPDSLTIPAPTPPPAPTTTEDIFADLDATDIDNYIADNLEDFEHELYAGLPEN